MSDTVTPPLPVGTPVQLGAEHRWNRVHLAEVVDDDTARGAVCPFLADVDALELVAVRVTETVVVRNPDVVTLPVMPADCEPVADVVPNGTVWWVSRERVTAARPA